MPTIHPTAHVPKSVKMHETVEIGPYCVLDGNITLGPYCRLTAHACLKGPLQMGAYNTLYPYACLGYEPQDTKFDPDHAGPGLVIGDHNTFREGVTVHRGTEKPTTIGHHNHLMANTHLGHDVTLGNHVTLANGALLAGHVHVGDHAFLGGNAGIHQYTRIGRLAMISGLAPVTRDVPPFSLVYFTGRVGSLNLVGLRRNGLRAHIDPLSQAFEILYRRSHSNPIAADHIEETLGHDELCREFAEFIRHTQRGLLPPVDSERSE